MGSQVRERKGLNVDEVLLGKIQDRIEQRGRGDVTIRYQEGYWQAQIVLHANNEQGVGTQTFVGSGQLLIEALERAAENV
jgi:hypothetical protein